MEAHTSGPLSESVGRHLELNPTIYRFNLLLVIVRNLYNGEDFS